MRINTIEFNKSLPNEELKQKLIEFGKAWKELSVAWSKCNEEQNFVLENEYPFDKCFDTLGTDVIKWINENKEDL